MSEARAAVDRSFEELYRGHRADVYRAALSRVGNVHDAEDVTQAAFVDAYRAVLRGSQPEAPRAWLLAIAENVRRRRFRSAQRRPREEPLDADFPLAAELSHELARALAEALAALPAEQRQVFVLRELGGLSYDEIARATESSVGAIQMLLFRARRSLREQLEPPAVGRRRAGLFLPLPGWLAGLVSRAEVAVLTPRAAGAVGASVAAVAATVAVNGVHADGAARPVVAPRTPIVSTAQPAPVERAQAAVPSRPRATPPRAAPRPPAVTRARTQPSRAPVPVAATSAAEPPVAETASRDSPTVDATAGERALEQPDLPVSLPVETVEAEELLEPVPPVSTALTATAGAAGAAGADAPPLPVPGVPPVALPPAP